MLQSKDFIEFIESLNQHEVEFLVVGAFAVGYHARPRETSDLEVWIHTSNDNLQRIWLALADFGFTLDRSQGALILKPGEVLQLGFPPNRIDLLTSISGVEFESAWARRIEGILFGQTVWFIGLDDLLRNKRASGRDKDLHDVSTIERINKVRKERGSKREPRVPPARVERDEAGDPGFKPS
ncbi:MAG: hypothetical protein IT169_17655 [Bryobacterales bacterium]|nr:hypothetical protein [Bryobacterales bacterium]